MVYLYRNGFKPRYFVWVDHGEIDGLNGVFYNLLLLDDYNRLAHIPTSVQHDRVQHDSVYEMVNDAVYFQHEMEPENRFFEEAPNEEASRLY